MHMICIFNILWSFKRALRNQSFYERGFISKAKALQASGDADDLGRPLISGMERLIRHVKLHLSLYPFQFSFTPRRLHPASNGNSISESHPEHEGHAHHYVITITSSRGPNGGSSALPRPSLSILLAYTHYHSQLIHMHMAV